MFKIPGRNKGINEWIKKEIFDRNTDIYWGNGVWKCLGSGCAIVIHQEEVKKNKE